MGNTFGSNNNDEGMDWNDFTKSNQYRQNISNTYTGSEEVDFETSDPNFSKNQMGKHVETGKQEMNRVDLNFNLLENKMKVETSETQPGDIMNLHLPLYLVNQPISVNIFMCCKINGDLAKNGPEEVLITQKGPQGIYVADAYPSNNPNEKEITLTIPLRFGDYNMQNLTECRGDYIPLAIHLIGKGYQQGVSEMLFFCYFDKRNKLKPVIEKKTMKVGGVWQELKEVYGIKESALNNNSDTCCTICFTNPVDTIISPCNHMCLCEECANDMISKSHQCPLCRGPLRKITTLTKPGK